jgi:phosphoribosylformylglycinamidine cyclo-ligase
MSDRNDPYAAAGVNYEVLDPGKLLAQRTAAATAGELALRGAREVPESRGESAYVVDLGDRYLATVTEALGTKNLVADLVRPYTGRSFYDAIAKDTAATILNDLATVGARPLCLTAYWGAGDSEWFADQARLADLVRGWGAACQEAHCAWGGGRNSGAQGDDRAGAPGARGQRVRLREASGRAPARLAREAGRRDPDRARRRYPHERPHARA